MIKVKVAWELVPYKEEQTLVIETGHTKEEWDKLDDDAQLDILEEHVRQEVLASFKDCVMCNIIEFPWYKDDIEDDGR